MIWYGVAILSALSLATADAFTKRYFVHLTAYGMGLSRLLYTLPWLALCWPFIPQAKPDAVFFTCMAVALPLEVLAMIWYMQALRVSPLSLSLPFLAFTPIFILGIGWLLLGEMPSAAGIGGILLVVAGSYCLNISEASRGILAPFRAILTEAGSRLMLGAAFLYAITATLGKLAILHSNPYFFACVYFLAFTALMTALYPWLGKPRGERVAAPPAAGLLVGLAMAVMLFSHMIAISEITVAYMIALKRSSLLFGVLYGVWWFREENVGERLAGAVIMVAGIVLIGWFG